MMVIKVSKILAITGVLGLAVVGLAAPSHADTSVTFSGSLSQPVNPGPLQGANFAPSDVVAPTVTFVSSALWGSYGFFLIDAPGVLTDESGNACTRASGACGVTPSAPQITLRVDPSALNATVVVYADEGGPVVNGGFTVTFSATPGGVASAGAGPAPLIQQFPRSVTGTCDEAASEDLNWSGVASGGWSQSWSQWINEGDGGSVCTRMLVYNTSTSAWEVE